MLSLWLRVTECISRNLHLLEIYSFYRGMCKNIIDIFFTLLSILFKTFLHKMEINGDVAGKLSSAAIFSRWRKKPTSEGCGFGECS